MDAARRDEAILERLPPQERRALREGAEPGLGEWCWAPSRRAIDAQVVLALRTVGADPAAIERIYAASRLGPRAPLGPKWRAYLADLIAAADAALQPGENFEVRHILRVGLPGKTVWELHVAIAGRDRTEILPLQPADLVSQRRFVQRCLSVLGFAPRLKSRYHGRSFGQFVHYVSERAIDLPGRDVRAVLLTAIRALLDRHGGSWCASPTRMLEALTSQALTYGPLPWGWPTGSPSLTQALRRLVPALDEAGIEFHSGRWCGAVSRMRERYLLLRRRGGGTTGDARPLHPAGGQPAPRALLDARLDRVEQLLRSLEGQPPPHQRAEQA